MSSHSRNFRITVLAILSLLGLVLLSSSRLLAQDEETPKYDLFVGYQWLHPGGTVPIPGSQAAPAARSRMKGNAASIKLKQMPPARNSTLSSPLLSQTRFA